MTNLSKVKEIHIEGGDGSDMYWSIAYIIVSFSSNLKIIVYEFMKSMQ